MMKLTQDGFCTSKIQLNLAIPNSTDRILTAEILSCQHLHKGQYLGCWDVPEGPSLGPSARPRSDFLALDQGQRQEHHLAAVRLGYHVFMTGSTVLF